MAEDAKKLADLVREKQQTEREIRQVTRQINNLQQQASGSGQ